MSIDFDCLGKEAQRYVLRQLGKEKQSKYKSEKTVIDGIEFDSRKEATRYAELKLLEKAGVIRNLCTQIRYELIPKQKRSDGKTERACCYVADFVYEKGARTVVEDVKGYRDGAAYATFVIKRKLMLEKYGIEVEEV